MKLMFTVEEVKQAIADYASKETHKPITAKDVAFTTHCEGQYEDACEIFDGASVEYPKDVSP